MTAGDARTRDLAAGLDRTRERIARACAAVDRDPAEITLVVVTKTWPADDVRRLAALGVRDVGENRAQDLLDKRTALAADAVATGLRWHYIGRLQTNKARLVGEIADVVQSVDRVELLGPLARGAERAGAVRDCLVQVSLDDVPADGRGGVDPGSAIDLAAAIAAYPGLRVAGVMGVAPLDGDPAAAFARLLAVAGAVRAAHPGAGIVSAGMSGDLEAAIAAGATHLRVGSAVLGSRGSLG